MTDLKRWQPLASMAAAGVVVITAVGGLVFNAVRANEKADALAIRMAAVEDTTRVNKATLGVIDARMIAVDNQLHTADQLRNLMHANDLRITALLWQRAYPGSTFPTDNAYYPTIAQDR